MTSMRIIEASSAEEIDAARKLFLEYADSLGWGTEDGGWMAQEAAALPGTYAPPSGALLLAYVGDEPAGALGLQPVPAEALVPGVGAENAGELKRLYVRPESRRHGVGRALMVRAEEEARRLGYDSLVLTTSEELFPLAQDLYDSLGYGPSEVYRDDMPYPAIRWMRKPL